MWELIYKFIIYLPIDNIDTFSLKLKCIYIYLHSLEMWLESYHFYLSSQA